MIIYPNPATNTIAICYELLGNETLQLVITDINGCQVKSETLRSITVDISSLHAGMYFGLITTSTHQTFVF